MDFPEAIKELRLRKRLTQGKLGKELGVRKSTVSNWERGLSEPNSKAIREKVDEMLREEGLIEGDQETEDHAFIFSVYWLMKFLSHGWPEYLTTKYEKENEELVIRLKTGKLKERWDELERDEEIGRV